MPSKFQQCWKMFASTSTDKLAFLLLLVAGVIIAATKPPPIENVPLPWLVLHPSISEVDEQWEFINARTVSRLYEQHDENGITHATVVVFSNGSKVAYEETLDEIAKQVKERGAE